jgi:hypothetical protein
MDPQVPPTAVTPEPASSHGKSIEYAISQIRRVMDDLVICATSMACYRDKSNPRCVLMIDKYTTKKNNLYGELFVYISFLSYIRMIEPAMDKYLLDIQKKYSDLVDSIFSKES